MRRNWLRELRYPVGFGGVAAPFRAWPGPVALLARGTGGVDVAGVDAAVTGPAPRGGAVPGRAVWVCDEAPSWGVASAVGGLATAGPGSAWGPGWRRWPRSSTVECPCGTKSVR